jgi:dTDP-4-amino-4,6-dideoxygalactose transaminase
MDEISAVAQNHGLVVIEDAAHALEAEYKGKKIGTISPFTAFSFYATKNITTGEGGMLAVQSDDDEEKIRILSLHGISRDAWKRYSAEGYRHWDIIHAGYKYNMFDLQAAVGLHQMDRIDKFWNSRKHHVEDYNKAFEGIPEVETLRIKPNRKHCYHVYPLLLKLEMLTGARDQIMNAIQAENVGIGIHFRAVHLHPFYQETFGFVPGELPVAENASERTLSIPLFPAMTDEDREDVIAVVKKVIKAYRK